MFPNATVSSKGSSRSDSCGRNSSMPSLRVPPISPRTSLNPIFRNSDSQFTSFDASHFMVKRNKPLLRRFNSHDSHTRFADFSTESSPSSTNERVTSHSGTASSRESTGDRTRRREFEIRDFLERYSLPRVVRVEAGEPVLLYRCFDSFTKVQARAVVGKKGKEKPDSNVLYFPEGYSGWFSMVNDKSERCAVVHSTLLHLVREQVCTFLSMTSFSAYTVQTADSTGRIQYLKTTVPSGQVFRLRAVFQHQERRDGARHYSSTRSSRGSSSRSSAKNRDLANRYAQLIDHSNQELYAPLMTKGEFYEVHTSTKAKLCFPGMLDKTGPLALDKDCLYRLTHLLRRVHLPIKVKLLVGPLPTGLPKDFPDTFILEKKYQEPLLVTCTLPPSSDSIRHEISCFSMNSGLKLSRSMLGFDSEHRLFKSQRLQSALSFCQKNVEQWYREARIVPDWERTKGSDFCPDCRSLNRCKLHGKVGTDDDSIDRQLITKEALEKFPKSKKWYKHIKILGGQDDDKFKNGGQPERGEKIKSIDRYKDMSKLIEEKFGKKQYNPVKKSASFMFSTKRIDLEEEEDKKNVALLKCQSVDAQLHGKETKTDQRKISDISNFSFDFQMCILDNDSTPIDKSKTKSQSSIKDLRSMEMKLTEIDIEEIKPCDNIRPDLIPKNDKNESSFITDRLCSEFHVKTKIQKRAISKTNLLMMNNDKDESKSSHKSLHVVEVHPVSIVQKRALPVVDDLPYSHVIDEVRVSPNKKYMENENIYAEICDANLCKCGKRDKCACGKGAKRSDAEYCYVKLGSNGDSVTQSSDEDVDAIYNTLR